jgi:hypothetical protein
MLSRATTNAVLVAAYSGVAYLGVDARGPFDHGTIADTKGTTCVAPSISISTGRSGLLFVASFLHDTAQEWKATDRMNVELSRQRLFLADFAQDGPGPTTEKSVECTPNPSDDGSVAIFGLIPAQ